jgi:hypothetical protein
MREVAGGVRRRRSRWKECIRKLRSLERWEDGVSFVLRGVERERVGKESGKYVP